MWLKGQVPASNQQRATQHKLTVLPPGIINSFLILKNSYNPTALSSDLPKTSKQMRTFKGLYFLQDRWLKRNWLIGQRGPQHQIIDSCRRQRGGVTCSGGKMAAWVGDLLLQRLAGGDWWSPTSANWQWDKMTNGWGVASAWARGRTKSRKLGACHNWELDVWAFWIQVLLSSMSSAASVKLSPRFTGSLREMDAWGGWGAAWMAGLGSAGSGQAGSTLWSGREAAGGLEEVRIPARPWGLWQAAWKTFWRCGPKSGRGCSVLGGLVYCCSWNCTQAGERAAAGEDEHPTRRLIASDH